MIRVQAPDGNIVQFPEGTPDETINRVMSEEYGNYGKQRLRSMAQGLTLGFGDEIEAGLRSLIPGQTYEGSLKDIRGKLEQYKKQDPLGSLGYEAAGAVLPAVGGLLAAPFTGGSSTAAVAPTLGRLAARGAIEGGIYGFGTGEGDLTTASGLAERVSRVPGGAALGGIGAPASGLVMKGVGKVATNLVDAARRTLGGRGSSVVENEIQRLVRQTGKSADEIANDIIEGRLLAENETIRAAVGALRTSGGDATRIIQQGLKDRPAQTREAAIGSLREYLTGITGGQSTLRARLTSDEAARAAENAAYAPFKNVEAPPQVVDALADALRRVPDAIEGVARDYRAQTGKNPFFKVLEDGSIEFDRVPTVSEAETIRRNIGMFASEIFKKGYDGTSVDAVEKGLRNVLDTSVDGLSAVRANAAGIRAQRDAFKAGQTALSGDVNANLIAFQNLTDKDAIAAFRQGLMAAIEKRAATGSRQSMIRNMTNPETLEGKLINEVVPQDQLDEVLKKLGIAKEAQATASSVLGGSPTQERTVEAARRGLGFSASDIRGAFMGDPAAQIRLVSNIASKFTRDLNDAERARVASILVSQNPDLVRRAIQDESAMAALQAMVERAVVQAVKGAGRAGAVTSAGPGATTSELTARPLVVDVFPNMPPPQPGLLGQ